MIDPKTYQFKSEWALRHINRGRVEGRAEGRAQALLAVLGARGMALPDEARRRILGCTDIDQLDRWVRRAGTAGSIGDLQLD